MINFIIIVSMSKDKLLKENKELFWDVVDINKLDDIAISERFLKYWNWKNIIDLQKIYWKRDFKKFYLEIRDKKRTNLSEKTINFFNLYLNV